MSLGSRVTRAKAALAAATQPEPTTKLESETDSTLLSYETMLADHHFETTHHSSSTGDNKSNSTETKVKLSEAELNQLVSSPKNGGCMTPNIHQDLTPSTPSQARATPPASITNSVKSKGNKEELGSSEVTDLDLEGSVIPPLSHVVIKNLVSINDALIKVCLEFQNKNWTNEPDYAIYQRRLQSNLTYLAAVADYYLNPKQTETPFEYKVDMTPFPAPRIRSAKVLNSLLAQAMTDFQTKSAAIDPRLIILDRTAAVRAATSMAQAEKTVPDGTTPSTATPNPNGNFSPFGEKLSTLKKYDPPTLETGVASYKPFPPFYLPPEIKIPFESPDSDE